MLDSTIDVRALRKAYGAVEAVRGIDLSVARGEVYCLLGPNGAGKTTTAEIIEGHRVPTSGLEVVAQVARGDEVVDAARAGAVDVALLDIEMPGGDGLEAAQALASALPAVRALVLTTFARPGYLRRAMELGAAGFLLKTAPVEELARAIRRVAAGERVVDPGLAAAALSVGDSPLTAREREVLVAARDGDTVAALAGTLHLSPGTVRNYLSAAMGKLGAHTRAEAVRVADEQGWL